MYKTVAHSRAALQSIEREANRTNSQLKITSVFSEKKLQHGRDTLGVVSCLANPT